MIRFHWSEEFYGNFPKEVAMFFPKRKIFGEGGIGEEEIKDWKNFICGDVNAFGRLLPKAKKWEEHIISDFFRRADCLFSSKSPSVQMMAFDMFLCWDGVPPVHLLDSILDRCQRGDWRDNNDLEAKTAACLAKFMPGHPKLRYLAHLSERLNKAAETSGTSAKAELQRALEGVAPFFIQMSVGQPMSF